jgi:hypothetical protein
LPSLPLLPHLHPYKAQQCLFTHLLLDQHWSQVVSPHPSLIMTPPSYSAANVWPSLLPTSHKDFLCPSNYRCKVNTFQKMLEKSRKKKNYPQSHLHTLPPVTILWVCFPKPLEFTGNLFASHFAFCCEC